MLPLVLDLVLTHVSVPLYIRIGDVALTSITFVDICQ